MSVPPPTPASSATAAAAARVELNEVVQEYPKPDGEGAVRVIDRISLTLDGPAIHMLLGPSGCGKSTILRMMGGVRPVGVVTPTSGSVHIDGAPCEGAHDDVVMVFQKYANRPDLSVRDNVAFPFRFGLWRRRVPASERGDRVEAALKAVGLADKASHRPAQLSGGQNQRVALARALVTRPRILLMDEPFGALDAQTRADMQKLLVEIYEAQKCLVVFVTHDITEALLLGDRVIVLSSHPGRVADDFPIPVPRPRSEAWLRSADAVGLENRILALLRGQSGAHGEVRVSV
jgi:ABC-type nitrate/sulfonate/bicarbonate transport system ATPase subunit